LFNSFLSSAIHYDSTASIIGIRFISSADESIFKASVSTAGISVIAESANTNELIRDLLADDDSVILNDIILTDTNTGYLMYYVSRNPNANDFNYVITFDSSLTLGTPTEVHSWGSSLGAFGEFPKYFMEHGRGIGGGKALQFWAKRTEQSSSTSTDDRILSAYSFFDRPTLDEGTYTDLFANSTLNLNGSNTSATNNGIVSRGINAGCFLPESGIAIGLTTAGSGTPDGGPTGNQISNCIVATDGESSGIFRSSSNIGRYNLHFKSGNIISRVRRNSSNVVVYGEMEVNTEDLSISVATAR
jgi:hypothetical protein